MAQPVPTPDLFHDVEGYLRSPEDAAAYAIIMSGGQGFTTPAREARRMLAGGHPTYVHIARAWLAEHGLPEAGDAEPPGWQNWYQDWIAQHPDPGQAAMAAVRALPAEPVSDSSAWGSTSDLHAVPALPPPPPAKVTVKVQPGSRLESLLDQRGPAKAALDAAEQRMRAIKDGITAELTSQHPGVGAFDIPAAPGRAPLTLRFSAPRYFDPKWLRAERPDLYENYRKPSPRWTLAEPQKKGDQ